MRNVKQLIETMNLDIAADLERAGFPSVELSHGGDSFKLACPHNLCSARQLPKAQACIPSPQGSGTISNMSGRLSVGTGPALAHMLAERLRGLAYNLGRQCAELLGLACQSLDLLVPERDVQPRHLDGIFRASKATGEMKSR